MEQMADNPSSYLSLVDYAIVLSLIGLGSYWLFLRKKKSSDFDTSSIKTFSIESVLYDFY
jgi:hypothetical protein